MASNRRNYERAIGALQQSDAVMRVERDRVFSPLPKKGSIIIKDPLYNDIILHPLLVAVMDTPQFQRLRHIRQLGPLEFVFPGAVHTRFQHAVGMAHLAGEFLRKLCENDATLPVDARDVLCVQVAALLHSLGHGPYSHTFDERFLPRVAPQGREVHFDELSVKMFDRLYETNEHVSKAFSDCGLTAQDVMFIKELILPDKKRLTAAETETGEILVTMDADEWPFEGRGREKAFLYEIVSNRETGVDVDKFDYLARDAFHLGVRFTFDFHRFMTFCKVTLPDRDGSRHICVRDKEVHSLYDFYSQTYPMFVEAYQQRTVLLFQEMFTEALLKANDYLLIPSEQLDESDGQRPRMLRMSECVDDMGAYELLTDEIFSAIRRVRDPRLDDAKRILDDIYSRRILQYVGKARVPNMKQLTQLDCAEIRLALAQESAAAATDLQATVNRLDESDFVVCPTKMSQGSNTQFNPLAMRFFYRLDPDKWFRLQQMDDRTIQLQQLYSEKLLYVYARCRTPLDCELAERCFRRWCKQNKHEAEEARDDEQPAPAHDD